MKLTKDELKKIIQEEVANMEEQSYRVAGVGTVDDELEYSDKYYADKAAKADGTKTKQDRKGETPAERRARAKAEEEEEDYQKDKARIEKGERDYKNRKQNVSDEKMELVNAFIKLGGEDYKKSLKSDWDGDVDGFLESWLEIAYKDIGEKPPTKVQYASVGDIKKYLKKNKEGVYKPKRSFMQKAGRFLTGKGFNEDITKEDIQKMVQEELEAVTKGN